MERLGVGAMSGLGDGQIVFLAVLALLLWAGMTVFTIWTVVQVATRPPPVALVVALTTTTLLIVGAFIVTRSQELATLAGTGLGALSGAVAATWQYRLGDKKDEDDDDT